MSRLRSASSDRWLKRQQRDRYVKAAQQQGYRSRAVFKLQSIDAAERLFRPGQRVLDLGAAPGGWCQYVAERLEGQGLVVGIDCLPLDPLEGVEIRQGDLSDEAWVEELIREFEARSWAFDVVLSDMAPNWSGMRDMDLPRALHLNEMAWEIAKRLLKQGGHLLLKTFQGSGMDEFRNSLKPHFQSVSLRKPEASRSESREIYLLGKNRLK